MNIVVVGGSLTGLMAGIAFARAGDDVVLLDRADRVRPSGAALSVDESALRSILGSDHARAALEMANPGHSDRAHEVPSTWAGLYEGLCRAAEREPRLSMHHRVRVVEVGQYDDCAWVRTETGSVLSADLVIGADGHRSVVRRTVDPSRPDATFAGYVLWLGIASRDNMNYDGRWPARFDIVEAKGHVLLGYSLPAEDNDTDTDSPRLGWAWYDRSRVDLFRETGAVRGVLAHHSLQSSALGESERLGLAREAQDLWPRPWRDAILDSIRRNDYVGTPIAEYVPNRLVRGRIVIIGDAAHVPTPMTGRGFGTSLDDVAALVAGLGGMDRSLVGDALLAYQAQRLAPARNLVRSGQSFSRSFTRSH